MIKIMYTYKSIKLVHRIVTPTWYTVCNKFFVLGKGCKVPDSIINLRSRSSPCNQRYYRMLIQEVIQQLIKEIGSCWTTP